MLTDQERNALMKEARGIPCGNAWQDLTGDEKARLCRECNKHVVNLNGITQSGFQEKRAQSPAGLCVVNEPVSFLRRFYLAACAVLSLLLVFTPQALSQGSTPSPQQPPLQTPEDKTLLPEAKPPECQSLLYTPMMQPPNRECLDETGKETTFEQWGQDPKNKER